LDPAKADHGAITNIMNHNEFNIGEEFYSANGKLRWRCTDIGTRTIIAIAIERYGKFDESWYNGPPYAIAEYVFDEIDIHNCHKAEDQHG